MIYTHFKNTYCDPKKFPRICSLLKIKIHLWLKNWRCNVFDPGSYTWLGSFNCFIEIMFHLLSFFLSGIFALDDLDMLQGFITVSEIGITL